MPDAVPVDRQAVAAAVEVMALDAVLGPGGDLRSATKSEMLEILAVGATILGAARDSLVYRVGAARDLDCSWAEVGRALGISRQAAFQRFGRDGR